MAKAKCVHPDRAVAKACQDCPRRYRVTAARCIARDVGFNIH
jgi:hypothetical protein